MMVAVSIPYFNKISGDLNPLSSSFIAGYYTVYGSVAKDYVKLLLPVYFLFSPAVDSTLTVDITGAFLLAAHDIFNYGTCS